MRLVSRRVICVLSQIRVISPEVRTDWVRDGALFGPRPQISATVSCHATILSCSAKLDATSGGTARWMMRRKPALTAFAITLGDRFPAAETY
jgi:putative transposase